VKQEVGPTDQLIVRNSLPAARSPLELPNTNKTLIKKNKSLETRNLDIHLAVAVLHIKSHSHGPVKVELPFAYSRRQYSIQNSLYLPFLFFLAEWEHLQYVSLYSSLSFPYKVHPFKYPTPTFRYVA
jgi:hypothetical protein